MSDYYEVLLTMYSVLRAFTRNESQDVRLPIKWRIQTTKCVKSVIQQVTPSPPCNGPDKMTSLEEDHETDAKVSSNLTTLPKCRDFYRQR